MTKILQIVAEGNTGSVGRLSELIGTVIIENAWESYIACARNLRKTQSQLIRIGSDFDIYAHCLEARIFDRAGLGSRKATLKLIRDIQKINPDIIHLHHIHGYYINFKILFAFLSSTKIPVIWTFHDCWSFTGHCTHFDFIGCDKWKVECNNCDQIREYPRSIFYDRSKQSFAEKKYYFNSLRNLTIVPVSTWLKEKVKESFLRDIPIKVIRNGIDLQVFRPKNSKSDINKLFNLNNRCIILGVANIWNSRKGLEEFLKLNSYMDQTEFVIILVGLTISQLKTIPNSIIGIVKTENVDQLADLYSAADVFINPTFEDTYPTVNLESISCGTPVVTYNTGGSIESICESTGIVVEQGDIIGLMNAIKEIKINGNEFYEKNCRDYAEENFDMRNCYESYLKLYKDMLP